jgi:hypothetical protein
VEHGHRSPYGVMESITTTHAWEVLGVDWIGPILPTNRGYKYILMCIDYHTRWMEAFPTKKKDAPSKLLSDRDPAFLGKIAKELFKLLNITKLNTTSYHAQANGITEAANKTASKTLKALIEQYKYSWVDLIPIMCKKLRFHVMEGMDLSPYEMMFGRLPLKLAISSSGSISE